VTRGTQSLHPLGDTGEAAATGADQSAPLRGESAAEPSAASAPIAALEPALWKRLADASSLAEAARAWIALQCQMIDGAVRGVVLLAGKDANTFEAAGFWPEGSGRSAALAHVAQDERTAGEPAGMLQVAMPIMRDAKVEGVVAVALRSGRAEDGRQALRQLQWGVGWIRDRIRQADGENKDRLLERSRTALDLIGGALDHEGFEAAAMATVTGLALRAKCSRVSLGFRDGKTTVVKTISHTAQFGRQMNLISCLGAAMDEALDQRCVILYPGPTEQMVATLAHAELSRVQHDGQVLTVPLIVGERFAGALTFERPPGETFGPDSIVLLEHVSAVIGPVLEEKRLNDRWIGRKLLESVRLQFARVFGPGHFVRKLIIGAVVIAAVVLTFARATYRVDADAKIEGLVRRAIVAPYDGYIKDANARAGDTVEEGQVLATLEDRDLLLERLKWVTERQQHLSEYDKALANRQPAQINVIRAQVEQADAQIKLLDEQLSRIKLRSSIGGLVVSGDLSQMIGAAVQRGQLLFEVAPLDAYRVILSVDEREIGAVETGQIGDLVVSALPNETLSFRVDKITPIADAQSGRNVFRVEGRLTDNPAQLRPGMEGIGKIEIGSRNIAWIWLHPLLDWLRIWAWHWLP
jgi:multidrug resistance efflux pump